KAGAGEMDISGNNAPTYTAATKVSAGVLDVESSGALGTGATTVSGGAKLQIDGSGLSIGNALTLGTSGLSGATLVNLNNTNTLTGAISILFTSTANVVAGQLTPGGIISGAGGLTKTGTGTLILSNANTYGGATAVSQGTLDIQDDSALGKTTAGTTVSAGASLVLDGGLG